LMDYKRRILRIMPAANELLSCFHIHQRDYKWVFHAHQNWNSGKFDCNCESSLFKVFFI
jgi:hypothetical protein